MTIQEPEPFGPFSGLPPLSPSRLVSTIFIPHGRKWGRGQPSYEHYGCSNCEDLDGLPLSSDTYLCSYPEGIQSDALGDKSGLDPNGRKAPEVLDFLRKQWNATTVDLSCHSLQVRRSWAGAWQVGAGCKGVVVAGGCSLNGFMSHLVAVGPLCLEAAASKHQRGVLGAYLSIKGCIIPFLNLEEPRS